MRLLAQMAVVVVAGTEILLLLRITSERLEAREPFGPLRLAERQAQVAAVAVPQRAVDLLTAVQAAHMVAVRAVVVQSQRPLLLAATASLFSLILRPLLQSRTRLLAL